MTGVLYFSDRSKASCTMRKASAGLDGSSSGILEKRAKTRVSCSVWLEMGPGSSALTMTMPPLTPTYARHIRGSAATLSPTCFIVIRLREPATEAAAATSAAAFSLTDHST